MRSPNDTINSILEIVKEQSKMLSADSLAITILKDTVTRYATYDFTTFFSLIEDVFNSAF
jgi:hypothetical protein